jgi:hypothetical protein
MVLCWNKKLLSENSRSLRTSSFDSTVYKPISSVYLPSKIILIYLSPSYLKVLSRKTAKPKKELYIKDSWRSLYESIYSAIDGDQDLLGLLYSTQKIYKAAPNRPNLNIC